MNSLYKTLLALCTVLALAVPSTASAVCEGKWANPVTDFCWSCMLPLKMAGITMLSMGQEDNTSSPGGAICFCPNPKTLIPTIGIPVSFWEPIRMVDVTAKPFCMVGMGGMEIPMPGFGKGAGAQYAADNQTKSSTYDVHWYTNPILWVLESILDNNCLEKSSFDIAYLTEIDPLWKDDELTSIINPDVYLFGNLVAQAACAVDCVRATLGFGNNAMIWCAGCQGAMYPLTGNVSAHIGGVQASVLLAERMTAKLHRERILWSGHGTNGLCGYYPELQMDKTNYKYHMLYPTPADDTSKNGKCCQPFGRSTTVFEAAKEFPYKGEDFTYQIIRKRDCCQGILDKFLL